MHRKAERLGRFAILLLLATMARAQQSTNTLDTARVVLGATAPQFRRLIDLDGDAHPDALGLKAVTPSQSQVVLYRNSGNGTFTTAWTAPINWTVAGESTSALDKVVVGDFDGDNQEDDFAIALGLQLFVFQGWGVGGPGTNLSVTLPDYARNLSVVDLDQNGIDDLIIGTNTSIVPFRDPLQGGSALDPALLVITTVSDGPLLAIRLANGDLAVCFGARVWRHSPTTGWSSGSTPLSFIKGVGHTLDIDGDGDLDGLVLSNTREYQIIRQTPGSNLVAEAPLADGPGEGVLVDLDGDGNLDAVGGRGAVGAPGFSKINFSLNAGNGTFAPARPHRSQGLHAIAGVADLDGDGDLDVLAGRSVLYGNSWETLLDRPSAMVAPPVLVIPRTVTVEDLDDDGDLDLAHHFPRFMSNDGRGLCHQQVLNFLGAAPTVSASRPTVGDWNLDGRADLAFPSASQIYAAINLGGGNFQWGSTPMASGAAALAFTPESLTVDMDGDGDIDCVDCPGYPISILLNPGVNVAFNDGQGNFPVSTNIPSALGMGVGDFDGDGLVDVLVRGSGLFVPSGPLALSRQLAGNAFGAPSPIMIGNAVPGRPLVADLDGDGDLDIVYHEFGTGHVLLQNDGNANFTPILIAPTTFVNVGGPSTVGYALLDLDGDGIQDLVASPASETEDCAVTLRGLGGGAFSPTGIIHACLPASAGDIDGDGDLDIIEASRPFLHRNPRLQGPNAAFRLQYGVATPGSGGAAPTLGVSGSLRELGVATMRIRNGLGGVAAWLAISGTPTQLTDYPLVGITTYVDPFSASTILFPPVPLSGPANGIGVGTFDQSYTVPLGIAGIDLHHQAFFFDPGGPSGATATNALRIRYGL